MASLKNSQQSYFLALLALMGTAVSILFLQAPVAMAQGMLEEIIVTAQRREQSLQDVPVAVEVYSGAELRKQGWRNIDDLANFSPTVLLDSGVDAQEISIRGFGTVGPALTLDQAAPTFIDGIHFGRTSQVKLAFMDVQSVEVLKGPQPVYFGQNATAGAINIRSRRPTDNLEGYFSAEVDSQATQELAFGVGGPINDQWGYRVAGIYENSDGYLDHIVTGEPLGGYDNIGGRVSLQFRPNDRLQINGKVDFGRIRQDTHTDLLCRTEGPVIYGRGGPLDDPNEPPGNGLSVYVPPNVDPDNPGINTGGTAWGLATTALDQAPDCFSSNNAASQGGPFYELPQSVYIRGGKTPGIDMRRVADAFLRTVPGGHGATSGFEDIDSTNSYIDLVYTFGNDIDLQWISGYSEYDRHYMRSNISSPFLENASTRGEDYEQFSSELRITSATGGTFEWSAGAFFQTTDLIAFSSNLRGNVRQTQRYNDITEEVDYRSIFGTLTFNFMGDKASLDIGGRYQDDEKFTTVEGYGASWVFDVCPEEPCDAGLTPSSVVFDPALDGYEGCEGDIDGDVYCLVDPDTARFFGVATSGPLYAMPYRETRDIPELWWSGNTTPVGLTAPDYAIRADRGEGPYAENFTEKQFSPQIALRFRPTINTNLYAKYAEAVKIGGFDTGTNSIPRTVEELTFETEKARQIEVGVKGRLLDGRLRYDLDIFELKFPNLQVSITSPDPDNSSATGNAGQRVRGFEFSTNFAATENLILGFAGAIMDGVMTSLPGSGCTSAEISEAVLDSSAPCTFYDEDTGEEIPTPDNIIDAVDGFSLIDRTGSKAPRTPDWKFVLTADYVRPFAGNYEFFGNAKGYISDGYISASNTFDQVVKYNQHGDLSLLAGVRNVDAGWSVTVFARNLLEARQSYNPEFDVVPGGIVSAANVGPSSFASYGVKFEYLLGN